MPDKLSFEEAKPEEASLVVNGISVEDKIPEKAVLPKTEAERWAAHLEVVAKEDEKTQYDRRAGDLKVLIDTHFENVAKSHEMYPVRRIPYKEMTEQEQRDWNAKRNDIDMANRAYHLAVRRTCASHVAEDEHLVKLRAKVAH